MPNGPGRTQLGTAKSKQRQVIDHEQSIADRLGGRRQPASGALAHKKGDVELKDFLLDSKETKHSSITVTGEMLTKISREALEARKTPGLVLTLGGLATITPSEWVVIPLETFAKLVRSEDES